MEWLSNEILFYGGMVLMGCSLMSAMIYFCIAKIKAVKLEMKLNAEYGEREH